MPLNVDLINGGTIKTDSFIGNSISATTYLNLPSDIFVTGYTYSNNTFTLERTIGLPNLSTTIDVVTGLTVSGTLTATTISGATFYGDGSNLTGVGVPYKIYSALLTQSGTSAPIATILENTIGNIVWTRGSAGYYIATLSSVFTTNKTTILFGNPKYTIPVVDIIANLGSVNSIDINTLTSGSLNDNTLNKTFVEIRVYN